MKKGLLLINLGTPANFSRKAVRRYLKEFLSDPRVITLPFIARWLILNCFILPFRPKKTSAAYQAIWQKEGSPLSIHSEQLKVNLQKQLGNNTDVAIGMRYGYPSIDTALKQLNHCDNLTILPLFPQYASATTGSAIELIFNTLKKKTVIPSLSIIRDFYLLPGFIEAQTLLIKKHAHPDDYLLLSYHGLPQHQLTQAGCQQASELSCNCLDKQITCYRAQCLATSRAIQKNINLSNDQMSSSFQSRLGKTPWIKPYTDEILKSLRQKGIENIAIACPSFVSDCLETLEEIGIRAKEQWHALGGKRFTLIPCVNENHVWVNALSTLVNP